MTKKYELEEKIWLYPGKAGWYFLTIPNDISKEIDFFFDHAKRGWGSLRVTATIGQTTWTTSIFPDKKTETYLLPIKKGVRKKEQLKTEKNILCFIELKS